MIKVTTGLCVLGITLSMGCASITNDAYVPSSLSFSDGSNGTCQLTNKRSLYKLKFQVLP